MRLTIIFVLAVLALVPAPATAQQAGENINVLPVVFPDDDPDWELKGDGYLQRQVEPSIAASTRNPDHLVAFFNDYRAVDIADDVGLGETETMVALVTTARTIMMAASWISLPEIHLPPMAAAEAWVGMSRSYDGGLTWSGAFLPGGPFDASPASLAAPVHGLQAATDPVVAPGPCGKFYVVFMAFTRGNESKLVVARYQDLNNSEGGDSIVYQGMTVVESGNNATNGYFLDKPDIEVDIFREPNADLCADRVYVSYSTFNGLDKDGKFQSKVSFARSIDGGHTFIPQKLNPPYNQNQGSALAVDPSVGTPTTTGGGTIYMIWRHFWAPDAILMVKSTDYGRKWSKPVVVTGSLPMAAFDQPTIPTTGAPLSATPNYGFPEVAFRSNGFPTAAVTDQGTLFAAWQERVGINPADPATFGRPLAGGSPRIVVVRSGNGGTTWTDVDGVVGKRRAVDMANRDTGAAPAPGFGTLFEERASGPQVMPKLSFGGGRLMLAYYESRGRIDNYGSGTYAESIRSDADTGASAVYISGYDRVLDLRAALLDPATGDLLNEGSTTQVSRYPIRAGADLTDGEQFTDVAAVNSPCAPDSGQYDPVTQEAYPPCIRQVNRVNAPQSAAGTSPFIGDYVDLAPLAQFTFDDGAWRWATGAGDVPYQGFHSIFADNRHLIPPPGPYEWEGYQFYTTPFDSQCENAGSRNTDVLTSKVDAGLVLSAPTSYKQLGFQRGFPISISNETGDPQSYFIEISEGFDAASFVRNEPVPDFGEISLFAHSGTALMVYVEPLATPPIKIRVTQTTSCDTDCPTGTVTLNLDPANPPVAALNGVEDAQYPEVTDPFVINPFVINDGAANPFVINPFVINPFVINPFVINPFVINPFVINPFVINPFVINSSFGDITAVTDTTWTVTAGESNTASSYLPLINIDNAQAYLDAGYAFQLIVYKGSLYGSLNGCGAVNVAQPQILANVVQDPGAENPFVINPFVINPFVINPFVINPFVINSTFTMAPSDEYTPDGTTEAPPASSDVKVTLRAFKGGTNLKVDGLVYNPLIDPPSLVVVPLPCDPDNPVNCNIASNAPDLVAENVDTTPVEAAAGGTLAGFPAGGWTLHNIGTGDANAENGFLNHGFHICPETEIDRLLSLPNSEKETLDLSICTPIAESLPNVDCESLPTPTECTTLAFGSSETFGPIDLSIPMIGPGTYSLVLYVDDTLEISEKNEVNNWVAVPLTVINPAPIADDLSFTIDEDWVLTEFLVAHDTAGESLTYSITTDPTNGSVTLDDPAGGAFTYTPTANYNGPDSFTYLASDGVSDSNIATVSITVDPVNDAPTMSDVSVAVDEDGSVGGALNAVDIDGDTLSYSITTPPARGVATIDAGTGVFTYAPNPDLNGTDSFAVEVSDGTLTAGATVSVTVTAVPDAPVAQNATLATAEDTPVDGTLAATDADGDALSFSTVNGAANGTVVIASGGAFTYTPAANFNGTDSFTFRAFDGGLYSDPATVTINITPVNDPPVAVDATFQALENTPLSGVLVGYDVDAGDTVSFALGTGPASGTAVVDSATGAFTYTPGPSFIGTVTFTFVVSDGADASATGTVTITVIDPVPNWLFIGFSTPWRPYVAINAGSALPLKWYYADAATGQKVPSYVAPNLLEITATGFAACDAGGNPVGAPIAVLDLPEDAGQSDLRYNAGDWQLNWDTSNQAKGCYFLTIYHPTTNQIDTRNAQGEMLAIVLR
jgi:VCBS repeat-containing protein